MTIEQAVCAVACALNAIMRWRVCETTPKDSEPSPCIWNLDMN